MYNTSSSVKWAFDHFCKDATRTAAEITSSGTFEPMLSARLISVKTLSNFIKVSLIVQDDSLIESPPFPPCVPIHQQSMLHHSPLPMDRDHDANPHHCMHQYHRGLPVHVRGQSFSFPFQKGALLSSETVASSEISDEGGTSPSSVPTVASASTLV